MKFLASVLSIMALGLGLFGCSSSGGGGSTSGFAVSTTAANFGVVGNSYTSTLAATGGTAPYMWTDVATVLPALGLSLDPTTGVISGTPTTTTATAFAITFQVTDSGGLTASGSVRLRLRPRTDRASIDTSGNPVAGSSNTEPSISRTSGRLIAFSSTANLLTGVTGNQVYVHDRNTGQPGLVSKSSLGIAGIGGVSSAASISADGRFIAFVSTAANLVPGVSGQQIYLHDTQPFPNGQTTLVSKDGSGNPASAGSLNISPTISADGRFIAFVSTATNLVPGVSGQQIYLHDTQPFPNGQTTLVSKDGSGNPASAGSSNISPTISADGRFIAFVSTAANLVPGVSGQQIYLHDTQPFPNGQTTLVSKDGSGNPASAGSLNISSPTISADGRFVAFVSNATNLVGNFGQQIYLHDTQPFPNGQTTLVSKDGSGNPASAGSLNISPTISADGRFVAFVSNATNLVATVTGQQVYRHDTQTGPNGQNVVVSLDSTDLPGAGGNSLAPSITGNGSFVAFSSSAPLIPPAAVTDVYVRAAP
jgi:Tol biopolymer transport system component